MDAAVEILLNSEVKVAYKEEYMKIIKAAKGNINEKKLACQLIPKFAKYFPTLSKVALNTQLELAEDEDKSVRKLAFEYLPQICMIYKRLVPYVAFIISEFLFSENSSEIQSALMNIMEIDASQTLRGILVLIQYAEEEEVRRSAIDFLRAKFKVLQKELLTEEVEKAFLKYSADLLPKVSDEDFLNLLPLLSQLKIAKTIPVQNSIVQIIAHHIRINDELEVNESKVLEFVDLLDKTRIFWSPCVNLIIYETFKKIFPLLDEIEELENGKAVTFIVFKMLAEMSAFIKEDEEIENYSETVFLKLLKYLPLPPDTSYISLSHVECLLYIFVQFLKFNDKVLIAEDNVDRFTDLKERFRHLMQVASVDFKKEKDVASEDEMETAAFTKRIHKNLIKLLKDFYKNPPSFNGCDITFSWEMQPDNKVTVIKRCSGDPDAANNKKKRRCFRV